MKKSNLKILSLLMLVGIVVATVFSCKKTSFPPDPNDSIVVKRELVVSALNAFNNDSIGQFNVTITTPSGTVNQVATGNTYVMKDPVAGNYTVLVTKTGFSASAATPFTVVLPTDPKVGATFVVSVPLTKVAAPVTVTGTTGAVIAVKTNSEVASSAPIAAATIAPGTVFTLADGTKPATVAISVTNVPVNTDNAPALIVGGVPQIEVSSGVEIVNNQIPSQKLDLQPSGLVLSQPMTIDMYIGDDYPSDMPLAEKIARQASLSLNYVRKDGTVEVVTPDRFSADRNTVYYKISHFSEWVQTNQDITLEETDDKVVYLSPNQTVNSACGLVLSRTFEVVNVYTGRIAWKLTGRSTAVSYRTFRVVNLVGRPGFIGNAIFSCEVKYFNLKDRWEKSSVKIRIAQKNVKLTTTYLPCHN
jgi:hypothetical protein